MALLNYSTTIEASKTVGEIQAILAQHGASKIVMDYGSNASIEALSFVVPTPQGDMAVRLPIKPDAVLRVMQRQRNARSKANRDQAIRVAWRIAKDWVQAQMAILETEMVTMSEIFLPYVITPSGQTVFDRVMESSFLLKESE